MPYESMIYCGQKTWLEGNAVEQFNRVLSFEGIVRGAAFPDLHPGRGVPIGAAFLSRELIYPALIGNDIGCGMTLFDTGLPVRKLKVDKLMRKLGDDPEAVIQQLSQECLPEMGGAEDVTTTARRRIIMEDTLGMLGTLGHGNHFAEILSVEKVLEPEAWEKLSIPKENALLLIHSGSRAYGEALWRDFAAKHGDDGVPAASEDGAAYLEQHAQLIQWASFNRRLVARAFARLLGCELREILNATHNSITPHGEGTFIHRKGASAVEAGKPVVVAGSRGSFSYLVAPNGDLEAHLFSLAHGAGRKWNRQSTAARVREKHSDMQSLLQTKLGTKVICPDKELLYEEAPEAYKDIEEIIADLAAFELAKPLARLKPVVNIKP